MLDVTTSKTIEGDYSHPKLCILVVPYNARCDSILCISIAPVLHVSSKEDSKIQHTRSAQLDEEAEKR